MSDPELVVGVDGGATKTIALIATTDGRVVSSARGPGSNLYVTEPQQAMTVVAATVATAASAAGAELDDLTAGGFSLAGADCNEDIDYLRERCQTLSLARRVRVVNDSVGALYAGCPSGNGVAAACGTGFTVSGRSSTGRLWCGGHWTDWGSGRKRGLLGGRPMAEAVIRAIVDEELELGRPTALTAQVLDSFGATDAAELLHLVTARGVRHTTVRADVTRLLLLCANDGDRVARDLVEDFGAAMGDFVGVAAHKVGIDDAAFDLVLMGGVFREECPPLRHALVETVRLSAPDFRVVLSKLEPAHGAVLLALETLDVPITESVIRTLGRTSPAPSLFVTAAHVPWDGGLQQGGPVAVHH